LKLNKISIFFVVFFIGCLGNDQTESTPTSLTFFDLKGFFQTEIKQLKNVRNISKITEVNGQKETLKLDSIDFEIDLKIFSDADINKPSWQDKYSVDSLINEDGQISKLTYGAQSQKLKIRNLEIDYVDGKVSQISIIKSSSSAISEVSEKLIYKPNSGYNIEREQDITLSGKNQFRVEVKFERY
jgi:hypothetical protein